MSDKTKIEWAEATWNPVRGCTKISPGCKYCYADTFAERFRGVPGHPFEQGFDLRLVPNALSLPTTWKKPRRIFVNSMSDIFHEAVPDSFIEQVFDMMLTASHHEYLVLTKRSERMATFLAGRKLPRHIWVGVSVESADYLDRVDHLRRVEVPIRFLSLEPLLGPLPALNLDGIGWVIVGGESGPRSRPMQADWAREIREKCVVANVPFFFKQWGTRNKKQAGRILDGRTWDELPVTTSDSPHAVPIVVAPAPLLPPCSDSSAATRRRISR